MTATRRVVVAITLAALAFTHGHDAVSSDCVPEVSTVPTAIELGKIIAIEGKCFEDTSGAVNLGDEAQEIVKWADTSIEIMVSAHDPESRLTVRTRSGAEATSNITMSHANAPDDASVIVPGSVNIRVRDANDVQQLAAVAAANAYAPLFSAPAPSGLAEWWSLEVTPGTELATIEQLAVDPRVIWAEPAIYYEATLIPNDPCFDFPLPSGCSIDQWGLDQVHAREAWDVTQGSSSITVAVLDSGVSFSHSELSSKKDLERDYTGLGPGDHCPLADPNGHGTLVAGVAAAASNNNQGITGMSWHSKISSYGVLRDVFDTANNRWICGVDSNTVANAIRDAADDGARVINMSFAGSVPINGTYSAANYAWEKGAVLVGGAGNRGWAGQCDYPAIQEPIICVAASTTSDDKASFSNHGIGVDVAAPGVNIISTKAPSGYTAADGTSLASPLVAGVAAVLASQGFYPCEIRDTILKTADEISWDGGSGRLNAGDALERWRGGPLVYSGNYPDGAIVEDEDTGTRYQLWDGVKYEVDSQDFAVMNLDERDVQCVPSSVVHGIPDNPGDKTLLREFGTSPVYLLLGGACSASGVPIRFHVPDPATRDQLISNGDANGPPYVVPPGEGTKFPTAPSGEGCHLAWVEGGTEFVICQSPSLTAQKWKIPNDGGFTHGRLGLDDNTLRVLWLPSPDPPRPDPLEPFPEVSSLLACYDTDGDGFGNLAEDYVGTEKTVNCSTSGWPSQSWPADLWGDGSEFRVDVQDIVKFLVDPRRLNTNDGDPDFSVRWDLNPGKGIFFDQVNVHDVTSLIAGPAAHPPMYNGHRAFGSPYKCHDQIPPPQAPLTGGPAYTDDPAAAFALDTDPAESPANTASSLGTVQTCGRIAKNETLDGDEVAVDAIGVDVTVSGVAESNPMLGFSYALNYDEAALSVQSVETDFFLGVESGSSVVDVSEPTPDSDGDDMWRARRLIPGLTPMRAGPVCFSVW